MSLVEQPSSSLPRRTVSGHSRKLQPAIALVERNPAVAANEIIDYQSLVALLRRRADELQISRSTIDHISGLPDGYSAKVLSSSKLRRLGVASLGPMLDALCLRLVAIPNDEAFARNRSRLVKRDLAHHLSASKGHAAGTAGHRRKLRWPKIEGTATATLGGSLRYVAPMQFEAITGAVTARMGGQE